MLFLSRYCVFAEQSFCLLSHAHKPTVFPFHQFIRFRHRILIADDTVIAACAGAARPFADERGMQLLHGHVIAVAHHRQHVLHVVTFGELRIRAQYQLQDLANVYGRKREMRRFHNQCL